MPARVEWCLPVEQRLAGPEGVAITLEVLHQWADLFRIELLARRQRTVVPSRPLWPAWEWAAEDDLGRHYEIDMGGGCGGAEWLTRAIVGKPALDEQARTLRLSVGEARPKHRAFLPGPAGGPRRGDG